MSNKKQYLPNFLSLMSIYREVIESLPSEENLPTIPSKTPQNLLEKDSFYKKFHEL